MIILSRSYKKHPVASSHDSLKYYKKHYNRRFRRRMNRGEFDDQKFKKDRSFHKIENFDWDADNYIDWYSSNRIIKYLGRTYFIDDEDEREFFEKHYRRK